MQLLYFYTGDTLTHVIEEDISSNDDAGPLANMLHLHIKFL